MFNKNKKIMLFSLLASLNWAAQSCIRYRPLSKSCAKSIPDTDEPSGTFSRIMYNQDIAQICDDFLLSPIYEIRRTECDYGGVYNIIKSVGDDDTVESVTRIIGLAPDRSPVNESISDVDIQGIADQLFYSKTVNPDSYPKILDGTLTKNLIYAAMYQRNQRKIPTGFTARITTTPDDEEGDSIFLHITASFGENIPFPPEIIVKLKQVGTTGNALGWINRGQVPLETDQGIVYEPTRLAHVFYHPTLESVKELLRAIPELPEEETTAWSDNEDGDDNLPAYPTNIIP